MLKLTKMTDYGMMAMHYLAEHADERKIHPARDIADAYSIPLPALAKTLQMLSRAELVTSQPGATGGYALARPANTISTLDVISAFDDPPAITSCTTAHGTCKILAHCMIKEPLRRINDSIRELLGSISIAKLTEPEQNVHRSEASELVGILHQETPERRASK